MHLSTLGVQFICFACKCVSRGYNANSVYFKVYEASYTFTVGGADGAKRPAIKPTAAVSGFGDNSCEYRKPAQC
jgi:hypothetical protein